MNVFHDFYEKFEDTTGFISSHKLTKGRQHNGKHITQNTKYLAAVVLLLSQTL